jgi:hypothetical protein
VKIERLHEYVVSTIALVGGVALAIWCGKTVGAGDFRNLGIILGAIALIAVCIALMTRIWVLIPLFWPLTGIIPITELPFAVRDMAVMVVFGYFLVLIGFKMVRTKPKFDFIDFFVLANLLYLATAFIRNPVGAKAFASEMVGGKPYFNVFIGFLAYIVLCRIPIHFKYVCRLPLFLLPAPVFVAFGTLATSYSPFLAARLGLFYSDFAPLDMLPGAATEDPLGRKHGLTSAGLTGMQILTSYFRPLTLLIPAHFGRFILALVFTVFVLLSGFRSAFIAIGVYIVLSTYFRHQRKDLVVFAMVGTLGLSVLALGNGTLFKLPLSVQRTLSFLPGDWDEEAAADARDSIDWRVEMWRIVWNERKWIKNKWLGDGFGFTRSELGMMEAATRGGVGFIGGARQEGFMINGVFHNGPLSAIRYVGAAGLVLYYGLMIALSARVLKLIRVTRGTDLFPATLFVGMPIVAYALTFPVGAGQFDIDLPQHLFMAGLIKLVGRTADTLSQAVEHPRAEVSRSGSPRGGRPVLAGAAADLR